MGAAFLAESGFIAGTGRDAQGPWRAVLLSADTSGGKPGHPLPEPASWSQHLLALAWLLRERLRAVARA